jgi:hypothetical protein
MLPLGAALLCAMMLIGLLACASNRNPYAGTDSAADYTTPAQAQRADSSYADQPEGPISVRNRRNERLVLFAGNINNHKILGGIEPNGERSFEIRGIVPDGNNVFVLRAVKETDYRANGTDPSMEIFSQMVVYDTNDRLMKSSVTIDQSLGGTSEVILVNNTTYVVEVAVGALDGNIVATLRPGEREKHVRLDSNGGRLYAFYPIFLGYSQRDKQITKLVPANLDNGRSATPQPTGTSDVPFIQIDADMAKNLISRTAYINVQNNLSTGVYFTRGRQPLPNQNGIPALNPGRSAVFELEATTEGMPYYGLEIDSGTGGSNARIPVDTITVRAGRTYDLVVTPDGKYSFNSTGRERDIGRDFEVPFVLEN